MSLDDRRRAGIERGQARRFSLLPPRVGERVEDRLHAGGDPHRGLGLGAEDVLRRLDQGNLGTADGDPRAGARLAAAGPRGA